MIHTLILIQNPTQIQWDLIEDLCCEPPFGDSFTELQGDWVAGRVGIWSIDSGLVLTQIINHPQGRELYIRGVVGRGILRQAEAIFEDLTVLAKLNGCRWVGGNVSRPGLMKAWGRLGLKSAAQHYVKEV